MGPGRSRWCSPAPAPTASSACARKSEGGIAIAQDPDTAGFDGMPRNAIATGLVDLVLPPEQIPEALIRLVRHPYVVQPAPVGDEAEVDGQLDELLTLVRARTRLDFRHYKRRTLLCRVHRRMSLHHVEDMGAYLRQLREEPDEVAALAADLTINVSGFFRDPEAWQALDHEVIASLVEERRSDDPIRIWVPGCATGEEAYAILMLLFERVEAAGKSVDVKVFATDLNETVLATARAGLYPGSVAADVGGIRLRRFFDPEDDGWRIKRRLREVITFAPHNILQDPPFARLDLISCRNLLIYLKHEVQKNVLGLFHFALRDGGHLFLGPAETVSGREDLFKPVSREFRIYRRPTAVRQTVVAFPVAGGSEVTAATDPPSTIGTVGPRIRATEWFQRMLLERHAPASVLVDRDVAVHAFHGPTGEFLEQPGGEPTTNLFALARDGVRLPLRGAVQKAAAEGREVVVEGRVRRGGRFHPVRITVTPLGLGRGADGMLVVSFTEPTGPAGESEPPPAAGETPRDHDLERELDATREELRLTVEQMETSNEELKASSEEIRSINEELQASNEELETSKEELQSLNEELRTVNSQLQAKVEELEARTNDLNNLLNSTDIATLFLDQHLRIRWFTPRMKALLALVPSDVGRPVYHFAQRFSGEDLIEAASEVLRTLVPKPSEVRGEGGRWYIARILPYRTEDNRIDGVVITFTDITERKEAERRTEAAKALAESIVDTVREPLLVLTPEHRVRSANEAFYRIFRVGPEETLGRLIYELGNRQWDIPALRRLLEEILPANTHFNDFEVEHDFQGIGGRTMLLNARRLDALDLILLAIEDVTGHRQPAADG